MPVPDRNFEPVGGETPAINAMFMSFRIGFNCLFKPISARSETPTFKVSETEEEEIAVGEAREWLRHNPGIPLEQVVAELGLTMEEVKNYQDPA